MLYTEERESPPLDSGIYKDTMPKDSNGTSKENTTC